MLEETEVVRILLGSPRPNIMKKLSSSLLEYHSTHNYISNQQDQLKINLKRNENEEEKKTNNQSVAHILSAHWLNVVSTDAHKARSRKKTRSKNSVNTISVGRHVGLHHCLC